MKASVRQQLALLDIQDLDTHLARLRRQRANLPERTALAALDEEYERAKRDFMAAQGELDAQRDAIAKLEDDVRLVSERRARDETLLASSTSPKEAQALQNELDTLQARQSTLEDQELEIMQIQEDAQRSFDEARGVLDGIDGRRDDVLAQIAAAEQSIDAQLQQQSEERKNLSTEIQGDLLAEYESLRARIGIGAARLRGNVSEASNMALTPAELSDIHAADPEEILYCPGTGAILVRAEALDSEA